MLVYAISREGHGGVTVVYGWLSARVRELELRLSDCSNLRVPLTTRPIFWSFIPMTRPNARTLIYPTAFTADLAGGETMHRRFAPTGAQSEPRCRDRSDEVIGRG